MELMLLLFMKMLLIHWLMDYPLQGDFLSRAKALGPLRRYHLIAHAGMHGCAIAWLLSNPWIGLAEWLAHTITDELKVRNIISFQVDQLIHVLCKIMWVITYVIITGGVDGTL